MRMWLIDPRTSKKSITVTMLVITFLLAVASVVVNLYNLWADKTVEPSLVWACVGFIAPFAGIYFNKRLKATSTGVSFESDHPETTQPSCENNPD